MLVCAPRADGSSTTVATKIFSTHTLKSDTIIHYHGRLVKDASNQLMILVSHFVELPIPEDDAVELLSLIVLHGQFDLAKKSVAATSYNSLTKTNSSILAEYNDSELAAQHRPGPSHDCPLQVTGTWTSAKAPFDLTIQVINYDYCHLNSGSQKPPTEVKTAVSKRKFVSRDSTGASLSAPPTKKH
ncbi:hypothetical protein HDU98_007689 [Podochytrium sp. JEL0797]|nr:hypothetical protein HDU98_007689 [Podochytrium sp. JEL0797]